MVDKFKDILKTITKEKGAVTLFAIMKMDEISDKWSIIICASWINAQNNGVMFAYIVGLINKAMNTEEKATIARVVLTSKQDHLTQELLKFSPNTVVNESVKINGNVIHEAYILESSIQN